MLHEKSKAAEFDPSLRFNVKPLRIQGECGYVDCSPAFMAIPFFVNEPSHHPFELEQPDERLYEGHQMTGLQGIRFANQQQRQFETLPRVGVSGLPPETRESKAIELNRELLESLGSGK